jgi:CHASE3 domain sensor protein
MTEPTQLEASRAYTRRAVDVYLRDVEEQRRHLQVSIEEARARLARASDLEKRISALEHSVGESFVEAHARAETRRG